MPSLEVGTATIAYRQAGAGPPVILLHASSSHSGQWKPLMQSLAGRFTTLAPDLHGYGRSDPLPQSGGAYSHHDLAIVDRLLERADGPAHLVGHSLGGTVAAYAAHKRPGDIASVTLIEPVLFNLLEEAGDARRHEYHELAYAMIVLLRFGKREEAARLFLDYWIGPGALDAADPEVRDYIVRTIPRVADDWYGISIHAPGTLGAADFSALPMPVLLMCAERTRPTTRGIVEILRRALPAAAYAEIPGAGHMAPVTRPGRVNAIVADFLGRHA